MPKPRNLKPGERALWKKVTETVERKATVPDVPVLGHDLPEPPHQRPVPKMEPVKYGPFRVGQKAQPKQPQPHQPHKQPVKMDQKAFRRMRSGRMKAEATIDLHGMTLAQAEPELRDFVLRAVAAEKRLLLVITGKGRNVSDEGPIPARTGVLRQHVPLWLRRAPLSAHVLEVSEAHISQGGGGALYVYLRRNR